MASVIKRQVYYFDSPGDQNTSLVIEAVSQRLEAGGVKKVVVASTSGETSLTLARKIKDKAEIIIHTLAKIGISEVTLLKRIASPMKLVEYIESKDKNLFALLVTAFLFSQINGNAAKKKSYEAAASRLKNQLLTDMAELYEEAVGLLDYNSNGIFRVRSIQVDN